MNATYEWHVYVPFIRGIHISQNSISAKAPRPGPRWGSLRRSHTTPSRLSGDTLSHSPPRDAFGVSLSTPLTSRLGACMPIFLPANAREYVFTGVSLCICLSLCVCDLDK